MKRQKISVVGAMLCVLGLGFSDTAKGQITTTPSVTTGMSFQVQSGGQSASQSLAVNWSGGTTTLVVIVPTNQSWLSVNGNPQGTTFFPSSQNPLTVTANTAGLATGATVSATISIAVNGLPGTQVSFPVGLTVGTPSILTANPATLTFSGVQNTSSGSPSSTPITITSSGSQLTYNASATTVDGGTWILLSNTLGIQTGNSAGFSVSVNPFGLAVGNYSGTVLVKSTTTPDSVTIAVSLSVTQGSSLNVTGTLNNYIYQFGSGQGGFTAQGQTLMVSTNSGSLNYSVGLSSTSGPTNWLVASSTGGLATSTPQPLTLSLSYQAVAALPVGTYTIQVSIGPTGAGSSSGATNVTATLIVSNNALLNVNTRTVNFTVPLGATAPPSQTITVTSSNGSPLQYQVTSNQLWLYVLPASGTTSANPTFQIFVNPANSNLAVSNTPYVGTLNVTPTNGDNYSIPITVNLTVTSATTLMQAGPDQLLFSYQTTKTAPGVQLVNLTAPTTVGFTVTTQSTTASNCPANFLSATANQNSTPATLTVSIAASGMTSGFCTGTVVVQYNNGSNANSSVNIPVTVDISTETPLLTVSPPFGFGVETATLGSTGVISRQISINSTDGSALGFSATASTPGAPASWLFLGSSSGTTQQYLQVQISPASLPVGTYTGSITISATNSANLPSGALTIPVVLTVSANTTVAVTPTSLTFTQAQGAAPPAAQTVSLTATGGSTTYSATATTATGSWLQVSPASGTATSTASSVTVSINQNSLSPGTYTGNVTLAFQNAATPTATIQVTLTVGQAQTVAVAPTSLTFSYALGGTAPPTQTLKVTSTGGSVPIQVGTVSTNPSGWLSVTPTSGSTGTDTNGLALTVSVAPASLTAAGTFRGTITITPTGQAPISVPVTITVTTPVVQPVTISNSASGTFGVIAPGELITIKGSGIGPATGVSFSVGAGNTVSSTLAGVQVFFDTIPGTPTYVSATQINVIVPYEIAGRTSTNVVVSYQGVQSAAISEQVATQAPGIYTLNATGSGQASVLNQNGTVNGPSAGVTVGTQTISTAPAAQGSVIAVYMTGGGQTNPGSSTGTITPTATLYNIPTTVTATINGVTAPVQFAGAAPGLITGVIQVNILVPTGVTGSGLPLVININGTTSASGPTVTVQ